MPPPLPLKGTLKEACRILVIAALGIAVFVLLFHGHAIYRPRRYTVAAARGRSPVQLESLYPRMVTLHSMPCVGHTSILLDSRSLIFDAMRE